MSEFQFYKLSEIVTFKYGKDQKKVISSDGKNPILGTGGLIGWTNSFLYDKPSVLLGRKGTINCPMFIDKPFWTIDTLFYTQINEQKVNPKYLFYRFKIINFLQYNESTGVPSLKADTLNRIEIKIHKNVLTQQKIAAVLSVIDTKIELNNRINTQLEAMAKTLYDYWFVQFDFPNQEGKPYKSSGGKMVYNEVLKREIPEGWTNSTLNDLGLIVGGSTPTTTKETNFTKNGTAWITPYDLSNNAGNKFITKGYLDVTLEGIKEASLKVYPQGTVLLSTRAPIGYMAIARGKVTTNQGFKSFIPNKGFSSAFIYYTVKNAMNTIIQYASGSTFKEISSSTLKTINICLPTTNISDDYTKLVSSVFQRQDMLEQENQQLTQLRDWLLPMLMNGQVKVS